MQIDKATFSHLDEVYQIMMLCKNDLINKGIYQWNEKYPSKNVLQNDIELQQLWVLKEKQTLVGCVVLTTIEDEEYKPVKWLTKTQNFLYIHRLAVHPDFQGKGNAQKLMDYSENYAIKNNFDSIRLDTFSQNKRNQKFYEQRNYRKLENIYFYNQSNDPFICFEKILNDLKS